MKEVDVRLIGNELILHFRKDGAQINAYTLANILVSLSDTAKEINSVVNPGYDIEIVVTTLELGSFKAKVKAVYTPLKDLFSQDSLKPIVLGVCASVIYQYAFAPDLSVKVNISDDMVIIEQGETRIVVPKNIHDETEKIKSSEIVKKQVGKMFKAIKDDDKISGVSIDANNTPEQELPVIENEVIEQISLMADEKDIDGKVIVENADLKIIKAILENSKKKWGFSWRGMPISAPVLDKQFYAQFSAHAITIAPGDSLQVRMKIYQKVHKASGVYINKKYEIVEVIEHKSQTGSY